MKNKAMEIKFIDKEIRVYDDACGLQYNKQTKEWEHWNRLASKYTPIAVFTTSNCCDRIGKIASRKVKGAKCIYSWERGNYIDDPYNRQYRVGTISCEIWDFRGVLGIEKPIEECIEYELIEMLKIKGVDIA